MTSLPRSYIRLPDGTIEPCDDEAKFIEWFADLENRRILRTAVPYGDFKKAVLVTTVFTGWDLNLDPEEPIMFETLSELPDGSEIKRRYATEDEARQGHQEILKVVEERIEAGEFSEFSPGLQELLDNPGAVPVPRPRQVAAPQLQAPSPTCSKCGGTGTVRGLVAIVPCDCAIKPI